MTAPSNVDQRTFKRILAQNVFLPLLLVLGLSVIFITQLSYMVNNNHWVDHSDQSIGKADELIKLFVDAETGLRGYLLTDRPLYLQPYIFANEQIATKIEEFEKHVSPDPPQVRRVEEVDLSFRKWLVFAQSMIEKKKKNDNAAVIASQEIGRNMMDDLRARIREIKQVEYDLRKARIERSEDTTKIVVTCTLLISLIVGGILALVGRKQLKNLSSTYENALQTQAEQNARLEKQSWIQTGQTQLSDQIRGELSFKAVCEKALGFLAKYLGAEVAALYVQNDDERFVRSATYAFDSAQAKTPVIYRPGESLVGQAVNSRAPILIDDLPENYISVSSGLGKAQPRQLLISPFLIDGKVNSVIELGFLKVVDTKTEELLRQISDTMGSAIRSAQYKERLNTLLEETQRQAEELQTQQEELRVSNEELEEHTRALRESQTKLESGHAELEQTNENLEEQSRVLEHQKDQLELKATELSESRAALETASQYKSQFLANMSHELRTPLNSSLILAKLLMENPGGNLNQEQIDFATTIHSSGSDLLNLINDILDLSKVEAGKLELRIERFDISRMVNDLKALFSPLAAQKSLVLDFSIAPHVPKIIEADQQRVEQILKNLLSNAIKFTAKGRVSLNIKASNKTVAFTVRDTGIGIPLDQQELIFHPFRQGDEKTSRKFGGTGLGLSIARELAGLLGGKIELESELEKGSAFILTLPEIYNPSLTQKNTSTLFSPSPRPLHSDEDAQARSVQSTSMPVSVKVSRKKFNWPDDRLTLGEGSKTLLVIEDDESFAKILFQLAHEMNFKCIVTDTADEGFEAASYYLPNAIILDLVLPDHLGLAVLDQLKSTPKTRHIPVHIISALDRSEFALQMGAIGFLKKPAEKEKIQIALQKMDSVSTNLKSVLVVEDDLNQRESICKLIGVGGIETVAVGTGQEALNLLKSKHFDCMIIDLTLPDYSGYELLEKMTAESLPHYPPVIVYTGRSLSREEEDKLRKYSKSVIIKGAKSPERLVDEVSLFLHQVESKLPRERQQMLMEHRRKEKVFENKTILIVDDDVRNIFALSSALELKGARIEAARNGKEALSRLATLSDIDFVLMDIMMPEMDGYEAMQEIRAQEKHKKLPIIALTAKAMKDDQERCLAAGANDYLAKPIDLDKLVSLIRVWMPV